MLQKIGRFVRVVMSLLCVLYLFALGALRVVGRVGEAQDAGTVIKFARQLFDSERAWWIALVAGLALLILLNLPKWARNFIAAKVFSKPRFNLRLISGTDMLVGPAGAARIAVSNDGGHTARRCTFKVTSMEMLGSNQTTQAEIRHLLSGLLPFSLRWISTDDAEIDIANDKVDRVAEIARPTEANSRCLEFPGHKRFSLGPGWFKITLVVSSLDHSSIRESIEAVIGAEPLGRRSRVRLLDWSMQQEEIWSLVKEHEQRMSGQATQPFVSTATTYQQESEYLVSSARRLLNTSHDHWEGGTDAWVKSWDGVIAAFERVYAGTDNAARAGVLVDQATQWVKAHGRLDGKVGARIRAMRVLLNEITKLGH